MIFLYFLHTFHLMAKIYMPICPHCQKKKLINYQIPTPPPPPLKETLHRYVHVHVYHVYINVHVNVYTSLFISSYGAPLAQRASYLELHSSPFGQVVQLIMIILPVTASTFC